MQFAIGSLILDTDFLVAYGCGLIILILFCMERFNQPTSADGSFVETLVPRAVSNGHRYIQTFVIYAAIMVIVYTGLSIVGPHVFVAFGLEGSTAGIPNSDQLAASAREALEAQGLPVPAWVPLAILVILTGGATHFRALNQVEFFARRLTHRLIGIPQNVESLAANIRDRHINLKHLSASERDALLALYASVTGTPCESLHEVDEATTENEMLRRWLRLCFLHDVLESKGLPRNFGSTVKREYGHVWDMIDKAIVEVKGRPLRLLTAKPHTLEKGDAALRTVMIDTIDEALHNLHALIAVGLCPLLHDPAKLRQISDALRLSDHQVQDDTLINRVLLAVIGLFFGVLTLTFVSQGDAITALSWATGAFMLHSAAALSAARLYRRRLHDGTWMPLVVAHLQIPVKQYLRVALRGYIAGTVALVLWYVVYAMMAHGDLPTVSAQLIWIPAYGTVAAVTAFWIAYDLDVVASDNSSLPRRVLQVLLQATTTALVAAFVTLVLESGRPGDLVINPHLVIDVAQTTAVAAAILGCIAVFLARPQAQGDAALATVPKPAGH